MINRAAAFFDKDRPNGIAWCPGYPDALTDITPLFTPGHLRAAVLAEREACARIAQSDEFYGDATQHAIAAAIRARGSLNG